MIHPLQSTLEIVKRLALRNEVRVDLVEITEIFLTLTLTLTLGTRQIYKLLYLRLGVVALVAGLVVLLLASSVVAALVTFSIGGFAAPLQLIN